MDEKLTARSQTAEVQYLPPLAPLDMPTQVLERKRDGVVQAFLMRIFARHA